MRFRSLLVPAFALLALTSQADAPQGEGQLPNLVTVSGNAESKTAPDMATIRIGVQSRGKTAKAAQQANNESANRLIAAALKVVPDRKAFQTSDLNLFPEYTQPGLGGGFGGATQVKERQLIGYNASNILTIRVDDITKVGPLVDAAIDGGATNIDSISFSLKDDKAARKTVLSDAVKDAREKAEALAEGLGLKLGDVYSVEEGGGAVVRPYEMARMSMAKMDTPVMPGQVSLNGTVTVRFRLVK